MIFDDGTSLVGYSASRVVDARPGGRSARTRTSAGRGSRSRRFSRRDADTYLELLDVYERYWKQAFRRHRFSVPPPWGTPDPLEELLEVPGSRIEPVHQFMTLGQLARDFFESPELQILFIRAATTSTGCFPDDVPGLQGLIHCLPLALSFEPAAIAIGGSQAITDALVSAGRKLGVEYVDLLRRRPDRRRERARRGRRARRRLAYRGGPRRQQPGCVADRAAPAARRRRRPPPPAADPQHPLRPRSAPLGQPRHPTSRHGYAAERDNPGVGAQPRLYWGPKDLDYLSLRYQAEIYLNGFASRPYVLCSVDSLGTRRGRPPAATSSASRSSRRRDACSRPISGGRSRSGSRTTCCGSGSATRRT